MNKTIRWIKQIRETSAPLPRKIVNHIEKFLSDPAHVQAIGFWTSALLVGTTAVVFAKLIRGAENLFFKIVAWNPYSPLFFTPLFFLAAWFLVRRYAPEAGGSGIPQIMAANEMEHSLANKPQINRLLSLKTSAIKIVSSLLCVMGGGAIGREGPTLQISTSLFHFVGRQTSKFVPGINPHTWIVAGAASGLASAFNTPLGGIVYAIEEMGLVHFSKIRTALLSGVIVSGLMAQWLLGSYLYLGFPQLVEMNFKFFPIAIFNGLVTGLMGAAFGRILLALLNRRLAFKKTSHLAALTLLSGIIMALLIVFDRRSAGPGIDLITGYLFKNEVASYGLVLLRFVGTMVSYLSGAAGGIFAPSLSIGGSIGSFLCDFLGTGHPNLMVLLGMIGFLTGVTRTPFTAFILVLEMTDRHSAIFPMMMAALAAQWVAHYVDTKSFYEHVKIKFMPKGSVKLPPPPA